MHRFCSLVGTILWRSIIRLLAKRFSETKQRHLCYLDFSNHYVIRTAGICLLHYHIYIYIYMHILYHITYIYIIYLYKISVSYPIISYHIMSCHIISYKYIRNTHTYMLIRICWKPPLAIPKMQGSSGPGHRHLWFY